MRAAHQPFDVTHLLDRALDFHRAGNLASAQLLYGQILSVRPDHFDALHLLGLARHQQGRNEEAHVLISSAYNINPSSVEALSNLGIVLHELGRDQEAVGVYDRALAINPRYVEAFNNRGVALRALDRPAGAVMSFDRAIAIRPGYVDAHFNRAGLLTDLGRFEEAVASYDQSIALRPDHFESHRGRGRALHALGKHEAALTSFTHAVALRPHDPDMRLERGAVLSGLGRHQEALSEYDKVLHKQPDRVAALVSRGAALSELDRFDEAEACFRRAIALCPNDADAHVRRGAAFVRSSRYTDALASCEQALRIRPRDVDALINCGDALQGLRRYLDAVARYDEALAAEPDDVRLLNNRGTALNELKMFSEAVASLDRAIKHAPDHAEAFYNRGNAYKGLRRFSQALEDYEKALAIGAPLPKAFSGYAECAANICDWSRTARIQLAMAPHIVDRKSIIAPLTLLSYDSTSELQLACARNYTGYLFPNAPAPLHHGLRRDHAKLRIAYLSAEFNRHAISYLTANLFERHDRSRFEIIGISFGPDDNSETRARVVAAFDAFHDVRGMCDFDVAKQLNEMEIDIAVDIKGYTRDARPGILAHRPAPIQVSYLGFPGTMGSDFIDYIMADPVVVPPAEDRFYTEKIVRLPDCYQVNDSRRAVAERTPTRREAGLPERGFVFCSFNGNYKITAPVFDVWTRILKGTAGSVLWLLRDDAIAERNLRQHAAARDVDPARLVFAERVEHSEHLARHRLADLFLDTLPYNAHAACSDALWAGLPVLTCRGRSFAGRVAASLLQAVGLPELITSSLEDYAALALWLSEDISLLGEIRKRLAENRLNHPLFDTDLTRRHIEAAYTMMWRLWLGGESPRSFQIEPFDEIEVPVARTAVER